MHFLGLPMKVISLIKHNYAKLCDLEDMKIIPHSNKIILILGHGTEPCTIAETLSYREFSQQSQLSADDKCYRSRPPIYSPYLRTRTL